MPRLRVHNFAISLDGYGAGPTQGRENPLGIELAVREDNAIPIHAA